MNEPVRILQIVGIVCGGGVENVVMNYYRNIDRSKVQFDFIVDGYNKSLIEDEVHTLGGNVYHVEPYKKNIFKYMYQIYKIIKKKQYIIVHSHMNSLGIFSLFPARLAGAKIRIIHNHTTANKGEKIKYALKSILRPLAQLFANQYFACSYLAARWMYGDEENRKKHVKIINNAIELSRYAYDDCDRRKYRKIIGATDESIVIGHVGRFVFAKNHDFLIDVFYELHKIRRDSYLLLVGDGELKNKIIKKVDSYGLSDYVKFFGLRNDVNKLYNAMDVFVLPSWFEGLPVVSIEAQANGLRCIFSNNVTNECEISSTSFFLDIMLGASKWAEAIINLDTERNKNAALELQNAGFDIRKEAERLMIIYEKYVELAKSAND